MWARTPRHPALVRRLKLVSTSGARWKIGRSEPLPMTCLSTAAVGPPLMPDPGLTTLRIGLALVVCTCPRRLPMSRALTCLTCWRVTAPLLRSLVVLVSPLDLEVGLR